MEETAVIATDGRRQGRFVAPKNGQDKGIIAAYRESYQLYCSDESNTNKFDKRGEQVGVVVASKQRRNGSSFVSAPNVRAFTMTMTSCWNETHVQARLREEIWEEVCLILTHSEAKTP